MSKPKTCPVCGKDLFVFTVGMETCPCCLSSFPAELLGRLIIAPDGMHDPVCVERAELEALRSLQRGRDAGITEYKQRLGAAIDMALADPPAARAGEETKP